MHVALLAPNVIGQEHRQPRMAIQQLVEKGKGILSRPSHGQQGEDLRLFQGPKGIPHDRLVQRIIPSDEAHCTHVGCLHCSEHFPLSAVEIHRSEGQDTPQRKESIGRFFDLLCQSIIAVHRIKGMG